MIQLMAFPYLIINLERIKNYPTMKIILYTLAFILNSNINAQNIADLSFTLSKDPVEITNALERIEFVFGFDKGQMDKVETFIHDRLNRFPMSSSTPLPNFSYDVQAWQSVDIDLNSTQDFNVWINHLNMVTLNETEQTFVGNFYSYSHPRFINHEVNIIAVSNFNPINASQSERIFFIITDMDRL